MHEFAHTLRYTEVVLREMISVQPIIHGQRLSRKKVTVVDWLDRFDGVRMPMDAASNWAKCGGTTEQAVLVIYNCLAGCAICHRESCRFLDICDPINHQVSVVVNNRDILGCGAPWQRSKPMRIVRKRSE